MDLPSLGTHKVIKDPIHGHVPLTKVEFEILQLPVFNRLHSLKQMSLAHFVFPGAVTSRFLHSVGTMYLASKLVHQILATLSEEDFGSLFPGAKSRDRLLGLVQTVRLAALLHDVGHGPFSHATEEIMRGALEKTSTVELQKAKDLFGATTTASLPVHEYYSYCLALNGEIPETVGDSAVPMAIENVGAMIAKKASPTPDFATEIGLGILRLVISSQLDADRMDYLVRDAYMTGVPYGIIDTERVISQMAVRKDRLNRFKIAVHERAIGGAEDMLDARFKMYKWVYSHHMVVAMNELLNQAIVSSVEGGQLTVDDFYWKRFESGAVTDDYVMSRLVPETAKAESPYRGLMDRRYIPVSLFKRPSDHKAFESQIVTLAGTNVSDDLRRKKIAEFLGSLGKLPERDVNGVGLRLVEDYVPRSPYTPLKGDDTVWTFSSTPGQVDELTEISEYFKAINGEWARFPSYFIGYVVPGKRRAETLHLRRPLADSLALEIATRLS